MACHISRSRPLSVLFGAIMVTSISGPTSLRTTAGCCLISAIPICAGSNNTNGPHIRLFRVLCDFSYPNYREK